jgi:uncharacterized membrane protein YbjE (DUF340 family)
VMKPSANQKSGNAAMSGFAKFGPLDQLDWLIVLLAVIAGILARQRHFLALSEWFLEWVLPFLLIVVGYKVRRKIANLRDRGRGRSRRDE